MLIITPQGTGAPTCHSEREFLRVMADQPGLYLANVNVPNSTAPGAFTREVDGVMLMPDGIYTVEVKGIRARGTLHAPRLDAWTIVDGTRSVPLRGRPHAQALTHSKYLASFLKDTGVAPGWIRAVLALVGDDLALPEDAEVLVTDNVYVVLARPGVGQVIRQHVAGAISQRELSVELVHTILTAFGCVDSAPDTATLVAEGFRTEAAIAAEIEHKRDQVRAEYLAAATTSTGTGTYAAEPEVAALPVAAAPSSTEWKITADRFAASVALDPDLTETGTIVAGVPMHRRLVSYAERKGVDLADVAAVVNDPREVLGDSNDATLVYCGADHAVSVRTLDGLALFYKPVALARAERQGAQVGGLEITARAARQAINQFDLPLEAVARMVTAPQERWWVAGTTDIAHARGEFVAVTSGHMGPVLYVQTRAMAVQRAHAKDAAEKEPVVADTVLEGVTIRATAVGWCNRRSVPLQSLVDTVNRPAQTWAGHSPNMEVRAGDAYAVLLDVAAQAVVAVMSPAEAVEYRDGIVKEGVRLSGRCVFLARRRKVSADEVIAAYRQPVLVARAPGACQTVYVGGSLAVIVEDGTSTVVDFTYAAHARAMIDRQELIPLGPTATSAGPAAAPVFAGATAAGEVPSPLTMASAAHRRRSRQPSVVAPSPLVMPGHRRSA